MKNIYWKGFLELSNLYSDDSIQKMSPLEFTRHRPDSYLGSNENSTQLLREIISNASDEFLIGNCKTIWVDYDYDTNVSKISDDGQGIIPNVFKEDGRSVLEMVYGDINTSGKYDKSETAVYKVSTGAFGIGAALTNFLSHWLIATSYREGIYETVKFEEGVFSSREVGKCNKNKHGVDVSFCPNEQFFQDARPNIKKLNTEMFNLACVCDGLKIYFNGNEIYHPNGLVDIINNSLQDNVELSSCKFSFVNKKNEYKQFNFCAAFTSLSACNIIPFCNYSLIEAGTPVTTVKSTITRVLNSWARNNGIIKDKEKNLDGSSVQEGMIISFNLVSQDIRYDSQTKVRVTSTDDNQFISSVLSQEFELWLDSNPDDARSILEKAIVARKAAEAAKKAREAVKKKAENKGKVFKLPTKLSDCWTKDRSKAELLVSEGISAASGLVAARNSEYQAVYGVRGKMLSILKAAPNKIMQNQEINNIVVALGLDYDAATGKMKYDKKKLRYDKIIACADAK